MKVFVVMGNDYPAAVFSDIGAAEAYCNRRSKENKDGYTRVYWRVYDFDLNKTAR